MSDYKIPQTEGQLLNKLQISDDPTEYLSELFDNINQKDDLRLRQLLKSLSNQGYINIPLWADNKPHHVELLMQASPSEYKNSLISINDSHDIYIGEGTKVTHSSIGNVIKNQSNNDKDVPHSFFKKHPILSSFLISFIVGFMFLFSFWKDIVNAIEGLF